MAIEKVVEIKVISEEAKKNISDINSVIDEQRAILVLLEEEYLNAKNALDQYNSSGKVNLAQEKALKKTLKERKAALQDQRLGLKKLAIEQRAANKEAKQFRNEQKETTNVVRGIDKLTGGFATKIVKLTKGFKSGVKGIKGFIGGLSGVKKALIGTGIGALVVLVGTLVANFDKIKSALFGISKQSKEAAVAAQDIADASQLQLENLEGSDNILKQQGKTEKEIRDLKIQQTDETIKSLQAQLIAQKTIRDEQIKTAKRNQTILTGILDFLLLPIKRITTTIDVIAKKIGKDLGLTEAVSGISGSVAKSFFSGFDEEGEDALEKTEKTLLRLRNKRAGYALQEKKEIETEKKSEEDAFFAEMFAVEEREQMRLDSIDEIREAFKQKQKEKEAVTELEKINLEEQTVLAELDRLKASEEEKQEVRDYYNSLRLDNQDKAAKASIKIAKLEARTKQMALNGYASALSDVSGVIGQETETGKSIAIASSLVNTYAAIAGQLRAFSGKSIPGYAIAQAIATGLVGLKQVSKIKAVKIPKSKGGGSVASGSISAATPAPPSFNIVGASDTNQLAEAVAGQTQEPVQAYVVANDVTSAQSLDRNIVEGASLG